MNQLIIKAYKLKEIIDFLVNSDENKLQRK